MKQSLRKDETDVQRLAATRSCIVEHGSAVSIRVVVSDSTLDESGCLTGHRKSEECLGKQDGGYSETRHRSEGMRTGKLMSSTGGCAGLDGGKGGDV